MTDRLFELAEDPGRLTPAPATVLACSDWPSNAALVRDLVRLAYLKPDDHVVDLTYGLGSWWTEWRPANLRSAEVGPVCFGRVKVVVARTPYGSAVADVVVFDPPYINSVGEKTSLPDFADRYGVAGSPQRTTADLMALLYAGLAEAARIVRPGGLVLVKAMSFTNGGVFRPVPAMLLSRAEALGLESIDWLLLRRPAAGPLSVVATRARQNVSSLLVLRRRVRSRTSPGPLAEAAEISSD